MKSRALLLSAALAAMPFAASAAERTYDLSGFSSVSVSAGIAAEIAVGSGYSVRADGAQEGLDKLDLEVRGAQLVIRRKPRSGFNWGPQQKVTVYVTAPELSALSVSSGASATATGIAGGPFSANASSGGSARIDGRCGSLSADVSSGGSLRARDLQCADVSAQASSGGRADVFASASLTGSASSGGRVDVYGGPTKVNINESSGGDVSIRD